MRNAIKISIFIAVIVFSISLIYSQNMKKAYESEVKIGLERAKLTKSEILSEADIQHLPEVVQKYLRYVGVIGKEKVKNFRLEFEGGIRSNPGDSWMKLSSVQYNFFDSPTRIFYIRAHKMGIPAVGIHLYKNETAIMRIKLAGLFTVADAKGPEMNQGETVTVFNDMCFMAPATLIDKSIKWEPIDSLSVKAYFTNGSITISATLFFNEKGELINFSSNDRYETKDGKIYKNYPWLTPVVGNYQVINGYRLPRAAKAIYIHPEGEFCYGEFTIKSIEYNCNTLK